MFQKIKILVFMIFFSSSLTYYYCSNDDSSDKSDSSNNKNEDVYLCANCALQPEALPENDTLYKGVFKGTLVGSTGNFKIDVNQSNDNHSILTITFDGKVSEIDQLTNDIIDATDTKVIGIHFSKNGLVFKLKVPILQGTETIDTSQPVSVLDSDTVLPDHSGPVKSAVFKETSSELVMIFEGNWDTNGIPDDPNHKGTYNIAIKGNVITGVWGSESGMQGTLTGTRDGDNFSLDDGYSDEIKGVIKGDVVEGTWTAGPDSGNITGKRTL